MNRIALIALLGLAGCATGDEAVYLAKGGERVKCASPARMMTTDTEMILDQKRVRECVEDYQRQGFQRVPGP